MSIKILYVKIFCTLLIKIFCTMLSLYHLKFFCTMLKYSVLFYCPIKDILCHVKFFSTLLKGYRRMSYLVLSQMESITAERFKLLIRTEAKGRVCKKYEKYLKRNVKSICMKVRSICMKARWHLGGSRSNMVHLGLLTAASTAP